MLRPGFFSKVSRTSVVQIYGVRTLLNGTVRQEYPLSDMLFSVPQIVSALSHDMTLEPGDVIATGTPPGVGQGRKPQRFLKKGDTLRLGIAGLGEQQQEVIAWQAR